MQVRNIELEADFEKILMRLPASTKNVCLLSGEKDGWQSRLGWNPCDSYELSDSSLPGEKFYKFIEEHQAKKHLLIGFLSYDLGYTLQEIKQTKEDDVGLPRIVVFAYDNYLEKTVDGIAACSTSDDFINSIQNLRQEDNENIAEIKFEQSWNKKAYGQAFEKIKRYIYDGVMYQINLTQKLEARTEADARAIYAKLSARNSAKMKAYFEGNGFELISMSPERFVQTEGKNIYTTPIKGTRPKGNDEREYENNLKSLLDSEKEKAELNMITDLLRNDLGKVCSAGSIKVDKERGIDVLSKVIHTYSLITGRLKPDITPVKALLSMFPGGSITGCPKHKAMEIIDELELTSRSAYCGSIFSIDDKGNLDSSILIRTLIKKDKRLVLSVGGGIVYDSNEKKEYQESFDKAASITEMLAKK